MTPEELFGVPVRTGRVELRSHIVKTYRAKALELHPDKGGTDSEFRQLNELYELALRLIDAGTYGKPRGPEVTVRIRGREHRLTDLVAAGDFCDIYRADDKVFKVARQPRDNDLVKNEAAMLHRFAAGDPQFHPFVPRLIDAVAVRQSGGVIRQALILERLDGFYTLDQVTERRGLIDPRDMAWMWRRLLYVLGFAHRLGVCHGAVIPSNVMIHPEKHGLVLIDWAYAVDIGRPLKAVAGHRLLYPPEPLVKQPVGPEEDIWMGARTMLSLIGAADRFPLLPDMPRTLRAYFRACLLPRQMRPADAWEMQAAFDEVLERTYGPRTFRPFTIERS